MIRRFKFTYLIYSILLSFFFLLFFWINNIYVSILTGSIVEKVVIKIKSDQIIEKNHIKIYKVSPKDKLYEFDNYLKKEWRLNNYGYFKKIWIEFNFDDLNYFKGIDIEIGNKNFYFEKEKILNNWKRIDKYKFNSMTSNLEEIHTDDLAIYEVPENVRYKNSIFNRFNTIINWSGDIKVSLLSLKLENFLQFTFLVLFFLSLFIFKDSTIKNKVSFLFFKDRKLFIQYLPSILLFFCLIILVIFTFKNYGVTWDEPVQHNYGIKIIDYYKSFFKDQDAKSYRNLFLYGGFAEVILELLSRIFNFGTYESRHFFNAIFGLIGIVGVWKIGNLIIGKSCAFISSFLLTIVPSYYGHMFFNSKDIPFAVGMIWSIYYICRFIYLYPDISRKELLKIGIAFGITIAIRSGGLLLIFYLILIISSLFIYDIIYKKDYKNILSRILLQIGNLIIVAGFVYFIVWIFWPWTHDHPILGPILSLKEMSNFEWIGKVLYNGEFFMSNQLPWHYIFGYLIVKLPEIFLLIIPISSFILIFYICDIIKKNKITSEKSFKYFLYIMLLLFSCIFPVIYIIIEKSVLYDEIRHLIFLYPILSVLAGITLSIVLDFIYKKNKIILIIMTALIIFYLVFHISIMIRLHPDQYVYYNQLAGGVKGADRKYETDYWANSYKEAFLSLESYLKKIDKKEFKNKKYRIYFAGTTECAEYYLSNNFSIVNDLNNADYAISITRGNADIYLPGMTIIKIEKLGCLLSIVNKIS